MNQVTVVRVGTQVVVRLSGDIDDTLEQRLRAALVEIADLVLHRVVIDCSAADRIEGAGVQFLITAAASGAHAGLPARYEALPLSVLPNDLDQVMFRQFAEAAEYPSDLAMVRSIEPATLDLVEWIRATGWTAPTNVAGS